MNGVLRAYYSHLALPLVDAARKTDSLRDFRELDESQWLTRERLERIQFARLRSLLEHASRHVPYYRDLFRSCGFTVDRLQSVSEMRAIPYLTKDILRGEAARMIAENAHEFGPRPHRSAGTTGQPIVIQMDRRRHSVAWADMYRWWSAGGWQLGDKQYVVAGAALRPRNVSGMTAKLYSKLNHFEDYSAFDLTDVKISALLQKLDREKGTAFLRGYASSITTVARYAASMDWQGGVRAIFTTAETLFPEQRKIIESTLHGPVYDQWGCRDGGISAFECDEHNGMHLAIENAVVEIVRDENPVPLGEEGEVVATDLFSFAMPIIRYKVGDIAQMSAAACSCGRGLPLVASVQGRVSGFLVGSGGKKIHGEYFSHVFWETPWVKEFQIVQDRADEIVVNIIAHGQPPTEQLSDAKALMQSQAGAAVRVRIELVSEIPAGPMGKRQFVICRVPE